MSLGAGPTPSNFPNGFANGISVRGIPLLQAQPGQVFWLNNSGIGIPGSSSGADGHPGTFTRPFATLQYAMTQCVDGRGDIIMVGPGHLEILSVGTLPLVTNTLPTGGANLTCAGVAVIGMGSGSNRPTFILGTAATVTLNLLASNISFQNCLFLANFAAITSVFTPAVATSVTGVIAGNVLTVTVVGSGVIYPGLSLISATSGFIPGTIIQSQLSGTFGGLGTYLLSQSQTVASGTITFGTRDFAVDNCEFRDTSSALNFIAAIVGTATTANAMDGLSITRCRVSSLGTTAATTMVTLQTATDRVTISDNVGNWAVLNNTAALLAGGANNITNLEMARNRVNRPNTTTTSGLLMSSSSTACTGHMFDNYAWSLTSTPIIVNTGTKLAFSQNFANNTGAADKSGLLLPANV